MKEAGLSAKAIVPISAKSCIDFESRGTTDLSSTLDDDWPIS